MHKLMLIVGISCASVGKDMMAGSSRSGSRSIMITAGTASSLEDHNHVHDIHIQA